MEVSLGGYALPVILTTILALIYRLAGDTVNDRFKPAIAVVIGIGLGVLGLFYRGLEPTLVNSIDYCLYGFFTGCSAVGLYELQKSYRDPRGG